MNLRQKKPKPKKWKEIIMHRYSLAAYQENKDYFSLSATLIKTPTKYFLMHEEKQCP